MPKQTFTTGQVLTASQMSDLQQTAMTGGAASTKTVSYVLVAADAGTRVAMNAAGSTTITVNTGLFSAGDTVSIQNIGAGVCTVTAGTATVNTSGSLVLAQYQGGILYFTSASAAIFFQFATPASGDIEGVTAGTGISGGGTSGTVTITNSMATAIDAKGDLIVGTGADTFSRLAVGGTNGHTLQVDSSTSTGLKWAAAAGGSTFSGASAWNNAAQSISNATWTKVTWNQERYDTDSYHSTSTNTDRFTAPAGKSGYYQATVGARFVGNATGRRIGRFQTNVGTPDAGFGAIEPATNGTNSTYLNMTWTGYIAAGDYVWYEVYQSSGGSLNLDNVDTDTGFMITYLGA